MQFGPLVTYDAMERHFKKMRVQSRTELLQKLYQKSPTKPTHYPEQKIQEDLVQAFSTILYSYNLSYSAEPVQVILSLFGIHKRELEKKNTEEKMDYLQKKIRDSMEAHLKRERNQEEVVQYQLGEQNPQTGQFEWVGVRSHFPNLRSIFQQILLQKVRMFDKELNQLTQFYDGKPSQIEDIMTTAGTFQLDPKRVKTERTERSRSSITRKKMHKTIEKKGFTNVLIRDHSQFTLKKWTKDQQKQFQQKKLEFRQNFHKNNQQTPIIFQFVKKYTKTVKARDNIYQKWQQRERTGISPEQLRYLCSTSLFLNKTLANSEKTRVNKNIQSLGRDLLSRLEFNIAQKIIETYKQFVKKVADLRAHFYEELTQKRKRQYKRLKKQEHKSIIEYKKMTDFLKFRDIFNRVCHSQKMSVILKPRIYRWVRLFISNLKSSIKKEKSLQRSEVFNRLSKNHGLSSILLKSKLRCPSSRVIKRQDHTSYRSYHTKYIPTQRFFYDKPFENHIAKYNAVKVKDRSKFMKQLTGGPSKGVRNYIYVDLSKKKIILSSKDCLKYVVMIQAKWKSVYQRKKFIAMIEKVRQQRQEDFESRLKSLKELYPKGKKIDLKSLQNRLKRVSMRILNILKPYVRTVRKPINNYTVFSSAKLSLNDMKIKHGKNSQRRLAQFGKMVVENHFKTLLKSGFVMTAKEINDSIYREKASAIWWAVKNSNVELAKKFLEGGGNPNSVNEENNSCLHEAIQNGALEIIFLLMDYGADLNMKNNKRVTPLFYATPKMLKWLGLEQGSMSGSEILKDNNSLFYSPTPSPQIYPQHYY